MEPDEIIELENLRERAGKLVNSILARNPEDWEAKEKLTSAHKQLRSIDTAALRQGKLIP